MVTINQALLARAISLVEQRWQRAKSKPAANFVAIRDEVLQQLQIPAAGELRDLYCSEIGKEFGCRPKRNSRPSRVLVADRTQVILDRMRQEQNRDGDDAFFEALGGALKSLGVASANWPSYREPIGKELTRRKNKVERERVRAARIAAELAQKAQPCIALLREPEEWRCQRLQRQMSKTAAQEQRAEMEEGLLPLPD